MSLDVRRQRTIPTPDHPRLNRRMKDQPALPGLLTSEELMPVSIRKAVDGEGIECGAEGFL